MPEDEGDQSMEVNMLVLSTLIARMGPEAGWISGWGGPWWILFPLAWIALAALVIWLVARRRTDTGGDAHAAGILAARYARGEIDTDEYRRRLDELKGLR